MNESTLRRFWAKVSPPDENGCMLWLGAKASGYGVIQVDGRQQGAHRVSLILTKGNTHCVAPAHLRWATRADNDRDKVRDGTLVRGERISHAKLSAPQVLAIRAEYAAGSKMEAIAVRYGVTRRSVGRIINREAWAWLEGDAARPFMTSRPALDREAAIERAARAIHRWDKRPIVWEQLDSETVTQYRSEAAVVVDAVLALLNGSATPSER